MWKMLIFSFNYPLVINFPNNRPIFRSPIYFTMRTSKEVSEQITQMVAAFANIDPALCKPEHLLTKAPILLDSTGLGFLTLSIRGYIKAQKPANTIKVSEVRKKDLTLKGLIDIVKTRI